MDIKSSDLPRPGTTKAPVLVPTVGVGPVTDGIGRLISLGGESVTLSWT